MAYVITDACADCKDTACVAVCPCDCIHPRPDEDGFLDAKQLYIDPDQCIDCGLCADECPPHAIFQDTDLPEDKQHFVQINLAYFEQAPK